jgi:hypothetical protein
MTKQEKIKYLQKYQRAKNHHEYLVNTLYNTHSVNYGVKSTVHKSLAERIQEIDIAYEEKLRTYIEIDRIIGGNIVLYYYFLSSYSLYEIAEVLNMDIKAVNKIFNRSIARLDI